MRNRLAVFAGALAVAAMSAGWLAWPALTAQTSANRAAGQTPRTADGHPDLQGIYNVATITPVERPVGVKSLVLTDQEAAALEAYEKQRNEKSLEPSRADRSAPPVGGETSTPKSYLEFLERAGGGAVGGYNNFWLAGWHEVRHGRRAEAQLADRRSGGRPDAADEARSAQAKRRVSRDGAVSPTPAKAAAAAPAGAFDGPEARPLAERCLLGFGSTSGPPTLPNYFYNNLKQIVQTRDTS